MLWNASGAVAFHLRELEAPSFVDQHRTCAPYDVPSADQARVRVSFFNANTGEHGMATTTYGGSASDLSERAAGLSDAASRQMDRTLDSAEHMARNAAEQGRQVMSSVDRTVREQPMLSLAAVAAAGLIIGALWKMDRRRW
jgi:ElaB/YqjD/DUF883 family membrane-anchored ribosome-binding protein